MSATDPTDALTASWRQFEEAVQRLHAAARSSLDERTFYEQLAHEAAAAVAATAAYVWRRDEAGSLAPIASSQIAGEATPRHDEALRRQLAEVVRDQSTKLLEVGPDARLGAVDGPVSQRLLCPILAPATNDAPPLVAAIVELLLQGPSSAAGDDGSLEFIETLADVAGDFEAFSSLRELAADANFATKCVGLLQRIGAATGLEAAAFELSNEGRRLLDCDRLSVLIRRGKNWKVAAVSGVDRVQSRADVARRLAKLADRVARWGEPIVHAADAPTSAPLAPESLPPQLVDAIEQHVDAASTRMLAAAPFGMALGEVEPGGAQSPRRAPVRAELVLIAECFDADGPIALPRQLKELGERCAPVLGRTASLDRFPVRPLLRAAAGVDRVKESFGIGRAAVVLAAVAAGVAALIYVPAPWEVEAPAVLSPMVQREVFASTTGAVEGVFVEHGQMVEAGQRLAVLSDPDLLLQLQQVRGDLDAAQRRLEAINVARTDRDNRDAQQQGRLPLSSEEQLLRQRIGNLNRQLALLVARRESLTLRSPIAGQVLTRDVQSLLESRPVERGQALLSVADVAAGWELAADVSQREIGRILDARESGEPLTVRFRLAGDLAQSRLGVVATVDSAAVLDADGLLDEPPPVGVRIHIDGLLPEAARPGMSASVRIDCGEKPLGYVWLYDVGATLYRWWTF